MSVLLGLQAGGGPTIIEADGNSSGSSTVAAIAVALFLALGSVTGLGAASSIGVALTTSVASSDGAGAGTGVGAAPFAGVASSDGTGAATGVGVNLFNGVGAAAGVGDALATSSATAIVTASGEGIGAAIGVGSATVGVVASSAGVGAALAVGEDAGAGFPVQYAGLRFWNGTAVKELCLVVEADATDGMGGVVKIDKNGTVYAVYLVETTDGDASAMRIRTTTGVKAFRLKT